MALICVMIVLGAILFVPVWLIWVKVQSRGWAIVFGSFWAAILLIIGVSSYFNSYYNEHVADCTVVSKEYGGEFGQYRVHTSNCGVLVNNNSILRGKYNSPEMWSQIPESGDVTFRIVGARSPFSGWFPNILEVVDNQD